MGVRGIGRRAAGSIATTAGLVSAMVLVAAAFAGDATVVAVVTSTTPVASTSPATTTGPVGVIAIGHSGLTGENSDPDRPFQPALENSWATGTNPDVDSVYLRLIDERPDTEGHVANTAVGGASGDGVGWIRPAPALDVVAAPQLVIIQTIDNDIRCDGTDADHVVEFGDSIADALNVISTASPDSDILMVGQLGRPDPAFVERLVAADPSQKPLLTGPAPCGFFDATGNLVEENFRSLTGIIDGYEAEQQRRCDAVAHCRTDGGVRAAYVDVLENFSPDWNHLNVRGQAAAAELDLACRRGHARTRSRRHARRVVDRGRTLTIGTASVGSPVAVPTTLRPPSTAQS